jgi:hypothetical protein
MNDWTLSVYLATRYKRIRKIPLKSQLSIR